MNPAALDQLRSRLLDQKAELLASQRAAQENVKPVELDQAAVGRVSRIDAMQMQQMSLEASRRRERSLAMIGAAMRRIDEGTYGICVDCGEAIDARRLDVDLTAARCVRCAEKQV
ncbi:MAG: TraR/DksA family transcriptional regulator [Steroidobacteraceae bacterium]